MDILCLPIMNVGMSGGRERSPVTLTIDYTGTQFVFKFKLPSTKSVTINWGDGSTEVVVGTDTALITKTSSYSDVRNYTFYLTGDVTEITYIDINTQSFVSGDISTWSALVNIISINAHNTGVSGDISGFSVLIALTLFLLYRTNVSGDLSSLSTLININSIQVFDANFTGDVSGWSTLTSVTIIRVDDNNMDFDSTPAWGVSGAVLRFDDCAMTSQQVDNMIASFSTCTNCTINVAGTNAHRTAASNDDLNTLLANGNTITLNDTLSAEMISDGVFSTDGSDLNVSNCVNGNYTTFGGASPTAFNATSNGGGMHTAGTADEISFVSGQKYIVTFDEVLNSGTAPYFDIAGDIGGGSISAEGLQLSSVGSNVFEFTSNTTTTGNLLFINSVTVTDFEITNISVKDAGWDVSAASWSIAAGVASYDDANDDQAILQIDGDMVSSIATDTVYRIVFTTATAATNASLAIKNSAEDVTFIAQATYTDGTHVIYFTSPADISGGGLGFVGYTSQDAFDLDDVSLKTVTFP